MMNAPYRWSGIADVPFVGLVEFPPITQAGLRAFLAWFEQEGATLEAAWFRLFQDMDWGAFVRACYGYPEQMRMEAQERVALARLEGQFGGATHIHAYTAAYYPVPVQVPYRPRRPGHRPPPPPPPSSTTQAPSTTRTRTPQTNTRPSSGTNQRPSGGSRPTGGRR